MNPTFYIHSGIPASGKSTDAMKIVDAYRPPRFIRVNIDSLRIILFNNYNEKKFCPVEDLFLDNMRDKAIIAGLRDGFNVISDDTNLHPARVAHLINLVEEEFGEGVIEIKFEHFDVSLEEAIKRDRERPYSVGEKVVKKYWDEFIASGMYPSKYI